MTVNFLRSKVFLSDSHRPGSTGSNTDYTDFVLRFVEFFSVLQASEEIDNNLSRLETVSLTFVA